MCVTVGDKIMCHMSQKTYEVQEVGIMQATEVPTDILYVSCHQTWPSFSYFIIILVICHLIILKYMYFGKVILFNSSHCLKKQLLEII